MPPCTQSFIPLPFPHEYNLHDMIASKRYESVWNTFLKELTRDSAVTLFTTDRLTASVNALKSNPSQSKPMKINRKRTLCEGVNTFLRK